MRYAPDAAGTAACSGNRGLVAILRAYLRLPYSQEPEPIDYTFIIRGEMISIRNLGLLADTKFIFQLSVNRQIHEMHISC
jgi:hypothetical protein